jgi:hypothetical protein
METGKARPRAGLFLFPAANTKGKSIVFGIDCGEMPGRKRIRG